MDSDEEILSDFSDSEIVESKHKNLVDTITSLDKKTRLKPASRKEPSVQISEYHLVNRRDPEKEQKKIVDVRSLVKSLKKKPSNAHIAKKITSVAIKEKNQTLSKPLEKIHSDKIAREVGFENVKKEVSKWDPIVFDNRISENIQFPLKKVDPDRVEDEKKVEKSHHDFLNTFKQPTSLELALANLLDSSKVVTQYREDKERREREREERREANKNMEFKMTLKEVNEKQKEMRKLRAEKAFRERKMWMQNKIKSKKYHRLMKREKTKEKLKEFEKLQKTDPEAALAQLELLDKTRAEERITLRHKSTGQWAKNLQVRAKYDKEARIALAEQLSQSRDLSKKIKHDGDSSDEDEKDEDSGVEQDEDDGENPWMAAKETDNVDVYFSGYRKYWEGKEDEKTMEEKKDTARPSVVETVSLEKLVGTLDDLRDEEDMDIPVFIEAVDPKPNEKTEEKKSVENSDDDRTENDSAEEHSEEDEENKINKNINIKFTNKIDKRQTRSTIKVDKVNQNKEDLASKENGVEKNKQKKRKSNIENILDKSGQWTVIPVDEEGSNKSTDNVVTKRAKYKCDTTRGKVITNDCHKQNSSRENQSLNGKNADKTKDVQGTRNAVPKEHDDACDNKPLSKNKRRKQEKLDLSSDLAIDEAFDSLENSWKASVEKSVKNINRGIKKEDMRNRKEENKKENEGRRKKTEEVDFNDRKTKRKEVVIDEAMDEAAGDGSKEAADVDCLSKQASLAKDITLHALTDVDSNKPSELEQIDPNQYLKVNRKTNKILSKKMPVVLQEGALDDEMDEAGESGEEDKEDESSQQMTIEEAFADDNVVQEFRQDKNAETKDSKAQDINLSLPGWGSWGGAGVAEKTTRRKRKRFTIKGVRVARKDDKKPIVIINEDTPNDLKQHLVDQVPHPFTSVEEYEASLRLPLGREWVPEIAHRKLIVPAVETRAGGLIEPIDYESQNRTSLKEHR